MRVPPFYSFPRPLSTTMRFSRKRRAAMGFRSPDRPPRALQRFRPAGSPSPLDRQLQRPEVEGGRRAPFLAGHIDKIIGRA
jgi:hypothetical protein